jgi:hypothetical protein
MLPALGGRSERFAPAVVFDGRFELPKPCGARPESVTLPCAFHERPVVPERFAPLNDPELLVRPDCADGGRLALSCDMRLELMLELTLLRALSEDLARAAPELFIEKCDAPAAGAVRAITLRFATPLDGRATFARALAAPSALVRDGDSLIRLVTCALRKEASVRCWLDRLMAWPRVKASCEAVVTA